MNIDIIKQVICNAIPSNVNISDIDIKEGNGKLTVQISWEILKAKQADFDKDYSYLKSDGWARADHSYATDFNQPFVYQGLPVSLIDEGFGNKLRDNSDKVNNEKIWYAATNKEDSGHLQIKAQNPVAAGLRDDLKQGSRFEAELKLLPLCRKLIVEYPNNVKLYRSGKKGQLGFLLGKFLMNPENRMLDSKVLDVRLISEVLERLLNESEDQIKEQCVAREQYKQRLIRAGIDPVKAHDMSSGSRPFESEIKSIKLPDVKYTPKQSSFKRSAFDGYETLPIETLAEAQKINAMLLKKEIKKEDVDSLINRGFSPKSISFFKERCMFPGNYDNDRRRISVVGDRTAHDKESEFNQRCKIYQNSFGGYVKTNTLGQTSVVDCDSNPITDAEVLLYTDKSVIDSIINEVKPFIVDQEDAEKTETVKEELVKKEVRSSKLSAILFHLKSIKNILRK